MAYGLRVGRGIFAEEPEPERIPAAFEAQHRRFGTVSALLGSAPWACLDRFTIVDVTAAPMLWRFVRAGDGSGLRPYPRLADWAEAVCGRPAWRDVVAPETGV